MTGFLDLILHLPPDKNYIIKNTRQKGLLIFVPNSLKIKKRHLYLIIYSTNINNKLLQFKIYLSNYNK